MTASKAGDLFTFRPEQAISPYGLQVVNLIVNHDDGTTSGALGLALRLDPDDSDDDRIIVHIGHLDVADDVGWALLSGVEAHRSTPDDADQ